MSSSLPWFLRSTPRENYFGVLGESEDEVIRRVEPKVRSVLRAHQLGDYDVFRRLVTDEFGATVSRDAFEDAHREIGSALGELIRIDFLASIRRRGNPTLLFAARYTDVDDDVLVEASFVVLDGKPMIDTLRIA